jgi:hypothetical protein
MPVKMNSETLVKNKLFIIIAKTKGIAAIQVLYSFANRLIDSA